MRTQTEIVERIIDLSKDRWEDIFAAQRGDLVDFLDYEHAKPYLKNEVTPDQWQPKETSLEGIKAAVADYMPFAWMKANDCRGISASRSIDHMKAYVWLTDDDDFAKQFEKTEYEHYGKEKLIVVCEYFGLDWNEWDDGIRTNG